MMALTRALKEIVLTGATIGISFVVFQEYVAGIVVCHGPSMEPTIRTNDILVTDQMSPRWGNIKTGDIVIARSPENFKCICKRVVAQSGELVKYKGDLIKIPQGHVWLEGDNKDNSMDSRDWGPLPLDLLRRRCVMKIWPRLDIGLGKSDDGRVYAAAKFIRP